MDRPGPIDLALSYYIPLVLHEAPLSLVENPGIERVLLLVDSLIVGPCVVDTSSYF
jgi:hypothetical protein